MMDWDKLWAFNKKVIDPIAPRYTTVLKDSHVVVNVINAKEEKAEVAKHPKNADVGQKPVWYAPKIIIDTVDAETIKEGEIVTFINWGNLRITKITKGASGIEGIDAEMDLDNKDYKKTTKLTWLALTDEAPLVPTVCMYYDNLISKGNLAKDEDFKNFIKADNKKEEVMLGDPELVGLKKGDIIQVQRRGFFICDRVANASEPLVLIFIPDGKETAPTANAADGGKVAQGRNFCDRTRYD